MDSSPSITAFSSKSIVTILHYAVVGILLIGGFAYWYLKPPTLNPVTDPKAAEAMALVQTHQAVDAPTLLQSLANRTKVVEDRGKGVRLGEWQVEHVKDSQYMVRVWLREEGTRQWFEREYVWRVHLDTRQVMPMSNFAIELMPQRDESRPRPIPPMPVP